MKRFCVNCGKETDRLVDSLCNECYLKKHEVLPLPDNIVIDYDWRSGRIRVGRPWVDRSDEVISNFIKDKALAMAKPKLLKITGLEVLLRHEGVEPNEELFAAVSFTADMDGVPIEVKKEIEVRLRRTISDASMKISSYYHEAIIQLRFLKKPTLQEGRDRLKEVLGMIASYKKKIELSHAIDTKNVPGGADILVASAKAAKHVAYQMAKKYKTAPIYSNKMIGMDDNGVTKYRHTYCIKI